jgi:branched-chain amino acid transport system ATP-binding protein
MTTPAERKVKIKVENLSLSFSGVKALDNISLDIYENEILAIIGPDGAGKTSLLDCITGFTKPQSGNIYLEGNKITRVAPDKAAQLGLARTFQNIELDSGLSTLDNLMTARHIMVSQNLLTAAIYYGPAHGEEIDQRRTVEDTINFLEMESVRKNIVGTLSDSMRKRVELGRALALEPEVLLLDEPMAGLNPAEKEGITGFISNLFKGEGDVYPRTPVLRDGVNCIVLFEHDLAAVMNVASRVIVLDSGKKLAEGTPQEVKNNPQLISAYSGK